jgi:hypothetical protein
LVDAKLCDGATGFAEDCHKLGQVLGFEKADIHESSSGETGYLWCPAKTEIISIDAKYQANQTTKDMYCFGIRTLTKNKILACARMKSADADEIFDFA